MKESQDNKVGEFKRYFPAKHEEKKINGYNFFITYDEQTIYKKSNGENKELNDLLKSSAHFEYFSSVIDGSIFTPLIQQYIVKGFDLEKDGSYKSEFLHGYRLDLIDTYTIHETQYSKIILELKSLLHVLRITDSSDSLTGDWALHNLVYSLKYEQIFNVDLEGFLRYSPLPKWAGIQQIEQWFKPLFRGN